jgi:hypothetical protein
LHDPISFLTFVPSLKPNTTTIMLTRLFSGLNDNVTETLFALAFTLVALMVAAVVALL